MVRSKIGSKDLFSYLDVDRIGHAKPVADTMLMSIEFLRYQAEVAYEVGKKQVISVASTASTISIGWWAFFFGLTQEAWFMSSIGLMMVFAGTFLLNYWTPRVLDKARKGLEELAASKFSKKWLPEVGEPVAPENNV